MNEEWVFDLEGDGLKPTKIHCLVATNDGENFVELTDPQDITDFIQDKKSIACHNLIRFDVPVLERLLGVDLTACLKIDTLSLSWYLYPEEKEHGLEKWGEHFGVPKPVVDDWQSLSPKDYLHRCREDVKINWKLWIKQKKYLSELYGSYEKSKKLIRYLGFKMYCARLQEESQWKLDVDLANETLQDLRNQFQEKKSDLEKVMPKVPKRVTKSKPKAFYRKDGSVSSLGCKWVSLCEKHEVDPYTTNEIEVIKEYVEPNANSNEQVKDWLYSLGWNPSENKYVKNKKTGEEKWIPQINLPKNKGGGLCPNILVLKENKEPNLEGLESYYIIQHRIGVIKGFLENVDNNGYLTARVAGVTNTLRFKHAEIVNLPKPDNPFAQHIRSCLIAPGGYELCGSDQSSLEDRLKQHFIYPYDPEYVEEMNKEGFDPHLDLALMAGKVTQDQVDEYIYGNKTIKPIRDIFKNGNYA